MTNLIGKWTIAQMMSFDEEKGMVWMDAADILAKDDDKDTQMMLKAIVLIEENGSMTFLSPLPEGEFLGEKVGPWEEIKILDSDMIEVMFYRLKRAE